jgi:D-galactarolactone isomerase
MSAASPKLTAPPGACDSHIHIYDPRMKLAPNAMGPGPAWADVPAYRALQRRLGIERAVVVQPTAYGTDNSTTLAAMAALGAGARGVAVVDMSADDDELERLTRAGIRGIRFQMLPGGALPWALLEPMAARVATFGWIVQLQMDGRLLPEREDQLKRLPGRLVIDHIGKFLEPVPPDHPGFRTLLRLLDTGRCWLKLCGPYEVSKSGPPAYDDVGALARAAVKAAPERMIWASNWPHVSAQGNLPDDGALLDLLLDWAPDDRLRRQILVDNPAALYGFPAVGAPA